QDVEILPFDGNGIDKSIAKSARFSYVVPGYEEMLREQYDWMQENESLYSFY
ncbi:SDR family NAD(P)-dependent oxidoreductase, partial [Bacteroides fragilis]